MISEQLKAQSAEVQDVFAVARAALQGYEQTGEITDAFADAICDAIDLREDLGWDQ